MTRKKMKHPVRSSDAAAGTGAAAAAASGDGGGGETRDGGAADGDGAAARAAADGACPVAVRPCGCPRLLLLLEQEAWDRSGCRCCQGLGNPCSRLRAGGWTGYLE